MLEHFFMNFSKAFDVLNHFLLLAKLDTYKFSLKSTTFIQNYLNKRMQRSISIINLVRRRMFIVVCHRVQYLAHCSAIFSLMIFSAACLLAICVTTLIIILYILMAKISTKFSFKKRF